MTQYIFDTNFYINFVRSKSSIEIQRDIENNNEIEIAKGFITVFPIITAIELINHLNENNIVSTEFFKALCALVKHSNYGVKKGTAIPKFYDLLTMCFFNTTSKNFIYNNNILVLSHKICSNGNGKTPPNLIEKINQVKLIKAQEKENIIKNVESFYLTSLSPDSNINWNIFEENTALKKEFLELISTKEIHKLAGLSMVHLAMKQVDSNKIKLSQCDFENNFVNKDFKVAIDFFVEQIIKKMVTIEKKEYFYKPSTDPKKRWNSFYDMQLIFATEYENKNGRKTILVTNENKIRQCFKTNNKEYFAISPEEYYNLIK